MAFEFGIFHEFQRRSGQSDAEAFAESFSQVDAAERWGLDVIWLAELHFVPERSVASAPLVLASAIATRTRRLKVGIAVQVLPLCHPLRLAEEVATLDHISQGRLIFGVGRSGFPRTYEAYGVPYEESRERFAEVLEFSGARGRVSATRSQASSTRYATSPWCRAPCSSRIRRCASPPPARTPIRPSAPWGCRSSWPSASAPSRSWAPTSPPTARPTGPPVIRGRARSICAYPSMSATPRTGRGSTPSIRSCSSTARSAPSSRTSATRAGARAIEQRAERGQALQTISYDDALRDKVIVGTPATVAARLQDLTTKLGLNGVLAELNCGGLIPHDKVMRSLQLMCEEVAPRFR